MATDFNTKLHSILENFKDGVDKGVIDTLKTKACPEIIQLIFEQRSWKDDTYNLRDSFGWGVYYKGKQVAKGYLEAVPKATEGDRKRGLSGREQVDAFLNNYKPRTMNDIELVFVAGMYYAGILEWRDMLLGFLNAEKYAKDNAIEAIRKVEFKRYIKKG